ncbi:hypothetical protein [Vulgatibacter sp.]|uniref:hypothetical protein n=1 Tax=Vulgatibacter sp. TaxID=1971226 RepID=UPI003564765D
MVFALLAAVLVQTWPASAHAEEASPGDESGGAMEMELDLDALEEPPIPANPHGGGGGGITAFDGKVRIMGRFDATYELTNPAEDDHEIRNGDFKSYHHHIFIKASPSQKVGLFAEVVDGLFFEASWKPFERMEFKAGKILVPFGDPGFHRYYAAVQGDPTTGILLPNVWAEYGATLGWELGYIGPVSVHSDTYTVKGSFDKDPTKTLQLNRPATGNRFAVGERLTFGWNRITLSGSLYYDEWNLGYDLFLYGVDLKIDYGLIAVPFLKDLRFKGGIARAEVENGETGDYYKYADYFELAYGGFAEWVTPRLRYGSYIDDSRLITNKDLHNWSAALVIPADVLTFTAEYLWQMEEVDEVDNDLFRLMVALDF